MHVNNADLIIELIFRVEGWKIFKQTNRIYQRKRYEIQSKSLLETRYDSIEIQIPLVTWR